MPWRPNHSCNIGNISVKLFTLVERVEFEALPERKLPLKLACVVACDSFVIITAKKKALDCERVLMSLMSLVACMRTENIQNI